MKAQVFILEEESLYRQSLRKVVEEAGLTAQAFEDRASFEAHLRAPSGAEGGAARIVFFDSDRYPELLPTPYVLVALTTDASFEARAGLLERGAFEVLPKEAIASHGAALLTRALRFAALEQENRDLRERALKEFTNSWPDSFRADLPLREVERRYIRHVLQSHGGVQESAAKTLGIDRKTLYRRRKELADAPE